MNYKMTAFKKTLRLYSTSFSKVNTAYCRKSSTESQGLEQKDDISSHFAPHRTLATDPTEHGADHIGKFYKISPEFSKEFYQQGGFSSAFRDQITTFNETCLMVRSPALEIIDYLKNADYSKPVNRYVMYGKAGVGKTSALAHILHYASVSNWLILHVPWAPKWTRHPWDAVPSLRNPDRLDAPRSAGLWLQHFRSQNIKLLNDLKLTCSDQYTWSKREVTEAGDTLLSIADHGINRVNHASDCVAVILKELKEQTKTGKFKLLVAVDGVNSMFRTVKITVKDQNPQRSENFTLVRSFLKLLDNDWNNGAVVCTTCPKALHKIEVHENSPHTPRALLAKQGFELLEPFIPVKVNNYSRKEILSCLNYYMDRHFIRKEAESEIELEQLIFLSGSNPEYLMNICSYR